MPSLAVRHRQNSDFGLQVCPYGPLTKTLPTLDVARQHSSRIIYVEYFYVSAA